jgi:hypothetical protein
VKGDVFSEGENIGVEDYNKSLNTSEVKKRASALAWIE